MINKPKSWQLEKMNKIDRPLAQLPKENSINRIRNEQRNITRDSKEIYNIVGEYFKNLLC